MKESTIIISCAQTACGDLEAQQCFSFSTPAEAKEHITRRLDAESLILGEPCRKDEGDIQDLFSFSKKEGNFSYTIGDHGYHFAYLRTPAEYNVSEEEMATALEVFCNTGRSLKDYERSSKTITEKMHRYCQSELWKFIKSLIRAFANARYDDRNKKAHGEAAELDAYMKQEQWS